MNLEDLMAVWRSQDASPMHGANDTLLRLVLRQDEAKLRAQQRTGEWMTYLTSAGLVAIMAVFFVVTIYKADDVRTGWDFVIPIAGAVPAILMGVALYMSRRAQKLREQRFGESLRDQLGRQIAQLDYRATSDVWLGRAIVAAGFVGAIAIVLAGSRVNMEPNEPFDLDGIGRMIFMGVIFSALAVRAARRRAKEDVLPRKHRLEALLKDLDA